MPTERIKRFYTLDFARGFAALAVLVWHFQHFYYLPGATLSPNFVRSTQPFYNYLHLFYDYGFFAVQFFFCLSGFIFFWLYLHKIKANQISGMKFFWLRFSRLYPLHLLTLIIVLVLQLVLFFGSGSAYVYPNNDATHFVLNLFLINYWGFNQGYSFNGPSWSISMEIIAYIIFFFFARLGYTKVWQIGIFLFFMVTVFSFNQPYITQVIACFFVGGLAYMAYDHLTNKLGKLEKITAIISLLIFAVFATIHAVDSTADTVTVLATTTTHFNIALYAVAFPCVVLALALLQDVAQNLGRRVRVLGDISYGMYLIHFPIQLAIIGVYGILGRALVPNKKLFIVFIISTVAVSFISYWLYELPAQRYLRHRGKRHGL